MERHLSDAFSYMMNIAHDRGYIMSREGRCSIVNADAMSLLLGDEPGWQGLPQYEAFAADAHRVGWLVDEAPERSPIIRRVNKKAHLQRLQYEVNLVCNLECAHCYCSSSPRAPHGKSTQFVLDVVRQAAEMGVLYFDVTGGEPLVRKDLLQILEAIRAHGMVASLFTNATLIDHARARALKDAGVYAVQTSLDARTPALHDEIRGRPGAFERALRGIDALRAAGIHVSVTVCLNRRNLHEADAIVSFLRDELGLEFRLDRVITAGREVTHAEPLALSAAEYYQTLHRIFGDGEQAARKVCDAINPHVDKEIEPGCGVGATYAFLKHDGRLALCPTMTEEESPDFEHADVQEWTLERAWEEHPTFRAFRGVQCENTHICPSGKTCKGGCRSNAYLIHGRVDAPDEVFCNLHKNETGTYLHMIDEYDKLRREGRMPPPRRHPTKPRRGRTLRVIA